MKILGFLSAICLSTQLAWAQNVVFNKVHHVSDNQDKFLYKIDQNLPKADLLAELEVQGYSADNAEVFGKIYKKAKEVGANAFAFQPFEQIDGTFLPLNPANYKLLLYYVPKNAFPSKDNLVYIIGDPQKDLKIKVENQTINLAAQRYVEKKLHPGEILTISTKQLLGSRINLIEKTSQPPQYFQISGTKIKSNPYGSAGVNLKTGDIILLERSYAEFLTTIFTQQ